MDRIREWARALSLRVGEPHVHFHRGPQGQAVPCFDESCANPRLKV